MPYFERLPYAEILAKAAGVAPATLAATPDPQLMERAAAILSEGSRGLPEDPAANWNIALPVNGWIAPDKALAPLRGLLPQAGLPGNPSPVEGLMAGAGLPIFRAPSVKSGEKAGITISILNDSDDSVSWSLTATDLVCGSGSTIPRGNVIFTPQSAVVPARGAFDVRVEIEVPTGSPGDYLGILACSGAAPGVLFLTAT